MKQIKPSQRPGERHFAGTGPAARGAHATLAIHLSAHARALGLRRVRVSRSTKVHSQSHYLHVTDDRGRQWVVRISDHPPGRQAELAHYDLVSRDGVHGREWAEDSLAIIAAEAAPWFDHRRTGHRPPQKRKKRHERTA